MVKLCYDHGPDCPVYDAFNLLSKRGVMLIIKSISAGKHNFGHIKKECYNLNNKSLTDKLQELIEAGLVHKSNDGSSTYDTYHITPRGSELAHIIDQIVDWAKK